MRRSKSLCGWRRFWNARLGDRPLTKRQQSFFCTKGWEVWQCGKIFPKSLQKRQVLVFLHIHGRDMADLTLSQSRVQSITCRVKRETYCHMFLIKIGFQRGILFGHSDGATIASIYAASVSDLRVRGLILMAPHFFTEAMGLDAVSAAKSAYETGNLKERLAKYHKDVDIAFNGWNAVWLNPEFQDMNVADCIDHWRIPVLAIQGREDQYGSLAQINEIEDRIYSPLEIAILEQCGHAPHFEQPGKTLEFITDFTATLERLELVQVPTAAV